MNSSTSELCKAYCAWSAIVVAILLSLFIGAWSSGASASVPLAPPVATVALQPVEAYADSTLRGSGTFSDPDGDAEGTSTYRWLLNGGEIENGNVAQSLLLPLDGSLFSMDGQLPLQSQGLTFVTGRFGQAVQTSAAADSRLTYAAIGNADPDEGSIEMWLNLTYDLDDPAYDDYPRLFSYVIDDEHQLYVEVNADRIILTSRNEGSYYGTWPAPPDWVAGEWHHLAATWSAGTDRSALYYDCALVAEGSFPALAGSASHFALGSAESWGVMDAVLDEVRLSRRALSADEIATTCSRDGPAPNDEVILPPGQIAVGDVLTFELTPCDASGECGTPLSTSVSIDAPPLGALDPAPGLLPSGAVSVTLNLSTTAPADCRWSEEPDTPFADMPYEFQQGQGTMSHSTVVDDLDDLDEAWVYVRCADQDREAGSPSPERDADDYERWTHLRVLGSWTGGYPRLANIWGDYTPSLGVDFFAGYDLYIPSWWGGQVNQAAAIRAANPNAKILLPQNATYGYPQGDPLTTEWWNSSPGDPGYNCLLRDTNGDILLVPYWDHPMYNMTVPYCRGVLAHQSQEAFLSAQPELIYDGIYWDRLHDTISWLGDDIDSDLDGQPDDPDVLDAAYQAGMEDFFSQMRARLAYAVLMGNDGPQVYAPWLNGRLYEWQLPSILEGNDWLTWEEVVWSYCDWTGRGHIPHTTFIESAPEDLYSEKYTYHHLEHMPPAMEAEAAASYRRMRYGLTSALMGDGLFSYDYGADWHGNLWWYDEFGATDGYPSAALPSQGYLGQPAGAPFLLVDSLDTLDQVTNGDFEDGLNGWSWWVDSGAGAGATFDVDASGGISATAAAHIVVTSSAHAGSVEFRQFDMETVEEQEYTLSFWARSTVTQTLYGSVIEQTSPWTYYGFDVQAQITPEWQHFALADDASVTANDGKLMFLMGEVVGEVWLDNVQFQEGALGVWARPFSQGLAVINTTGEPQTVPLPTTYCKLDGHQAPLCQVRVDDDAAEVSAGWSEQEASYNEFGATVQVASGGSSATVTYTPSLAYEGAYQVLAWVAPTATHSSSAMVTIRHVQGTTTVPLDETAGEVGWHSLGTYAFAAGENGGATLAATGDGLVVADAFKWVSIARYNDGTQVSQLIVQPQDGVILLNSCHRPAQRIYLPLVVRSVP